MKNEVTIGGVHWPQKPQTPIRTRQMIQQEIEEYERLRRKCTNNLVILDGVIKALRQERENAISVQ